jgi:hypothetical protein
VTLLAIASLRHSEAVGRAPDSETPQREAPRSSTTASRVAPRGKRAGTLNAASPASHAAAIPTEANEMRSFNVTLMLLGTAALFACQHENQPEPATANSEMSPSPAADEAVTMQPAAGARTAPEQIAEARCHREKTCGNIGPEATWRSDVACRDHVREDWKADLGVLECPGGIDQTQLDECLTQIREESCNSPLDTLSRVAACTQGQICIEG